MYKKDWKFRIMFNIFKVWIYYMFFKLLNSLKSKLKSSTKMNQSQSWTKMDHSKVEDESKI